MVLYRKGGTTGERGNINQKGQNGKVNAKTSLGATLLLMLIYGYSKSTG